MMDAEEKFELKSVMHLKKYRPMLDKYHYLLFQESQRQVSSSEEVMLARLWDSDERQLLTTEKEEVKRGEIIELPELPETWSRRYVELYGHDPPQGVSKKCDDLSLMVDDQKFELLPVIKKLPLEQGEQIVPQHVKQGGSEKAQPDVIDLLDDDNDDEQNVIETTKDVKPNNHSDDIEDDSNN